MVLVTFISIGISPETFVFRIIVLIIGTTCPTVTFDAEMIVTADGKRTQSGPALQESLSQSDAGRYMISEHLFDGQIFVLIDILLILRVPSRLGTESNGNEKRYDTYSYSLHLILYLKSAKIYKIVKKAKI
jgi:hypothetical protein